MIQKLANQAIKHLKENYSIHYWEYGRLRRTFWIN